MNTPDGAETDWATGRPRPWQRLSVRLAGVFAVVTLLAVGVVGSLAYGRQERLVQDTVGIQLLNIVRLAVLLIDVNQHTDAQKALDPASPAHKAVRDRLVTIQNEALLTAPIQTLSHFDPKARSARVIVDSAGAVAPGSPFAVAPELIDPMRWMWEDGVARYTGVYQTPRGRLISALGPIVDAEGKTIAVVKVDYPVEIYLDRLKELRDTLIYASAIGAIGTLLVGLLFARGLTRPIRALTAGVARVAGGDLSQDLPVQSRDELGRLTRAFNQMLEGLRQRDFIRSAFGRYVSPEVAKELLESPDGLRFGGEKRVVTVLMSDLRGYTRFAERGDPANVMNVLNEYLARMTDVVIAHGGTVNEFIGDAVFAVFGAPLAHPDHAERAAACALAMQAEMATLNREHDARGLPRFEMGIGVNTGEAVVGNIGSEQRAKYAVVGSAVNVAARVEGATVGGQVFVTTETYEAIRAIADVAEPVAIQMKGLTEPLALYELRGMAGRYAPPSVPDIGDAEAAVSLPVRAWVIEGKIVGSDAIAGRVQRIGPRELVANLDRALPPLTNVKLRLDFPDGAGESADIYGKVTREETGDAGPLTRIHFTSMTDADRAAVEALTRA